MARIPQQFIDRLLERIDIVDVIGTRVDLKRQGRNHVGLCPFHDERTPSFSVAPHKQFYYCFGCGASGSALGFLLEHDRMEFVDAVRLLADKAGLSVPQEQQAASSKPDRQPIYDVLSQAAHWFTGQLHSGTGASEATAYLESRQLSKDIIETFGIGFAPAGWDNLLRHLSSDASVKYLLRAGLVAEKSPGQHYDRFRHRIIFPIRDTKGRVIAFGGRAIEDTNTPKYLNSPESLVFEKGLHLYGLYEVLSDRSLKRLLFVEGYMDVLALTQAGIPGAVAGMGTAITEMQLRAAFRRVESVVFCFDGDTAGKRAAWRTLERTLPVLDDDRQIQFMFLPQGTDPDSYVRDQGPEAFNLALGNAVSLSDFLFNHLEEDLDTSSVDGRARLAARAQPLIRTVKAPVLRQLLNKKLETSTGLKSSAPLPRLPAKAQQRNAKTLARSVLRDLLLAPDAATRILADDRAWLMNLGDEYAILLDKVLRVLEQVPTDNTAVLVAQFAGQAEHAELIRLGASDVPLSKEARSAQVQEGWQRLHGQSEKIQRQQQLVNLKAQDNPPSAEQIAEFMGAGKD